MNGDDLRRDPLQVRKATLASILAKARPGIRFNEHIGGDGPTVFAHACKMGLEAYSLKRADRSRLCAMPKKVEAGAALANCRALINQINAGLSAEEPFVNVYLEFAASALEKCAPSPRERGKTKIALNYH